MTDTDPVPELTIQPGEAIYLHVKLDAKGQVLEEWSIDPDGLAGSDKPVVEILPEGRRKPFPGYLDFVLSFDDLKTICNNFC